MKRFRKPGTSYVYKGFTILKDLFTPALWLIQRDGATVAQCNTEEYARELVEGFF